MEFVFLKYLFEFWSCSYSRNLHDKHVAFSIIALEEWTISDDKVSNVSEARWWFGKHKQIDLNTLYNMLF